MHSVIPTNFTVCVAIVLEVAELCGEVWLPGRGHASGPQGHASEEEDLSEEVGEMEG